MVGTQYRGSGSQGLYPGTRGPGRAVHRPQALSIVAHRRGKAMRCGVAGVNPGPQRFLPNSAAPKSCPVFQISWLRPCPAPDPRLTCDPRKPYPPSSTSPPRDRAAGAPEEEGKSRRTHSRRRRTLKLTTCTKAEAGKRWKAAEGGQKSFWDAPSGVDPVGGASHQDPNQSTCSFPEKGKAQRWRGLESETNSLKCAG